MVGGSARALEGPPPPRFQPLTGLGFFSGCSLRLFFCCFKGFQGQEFQGLQGLQGLQLQELQGRGFRRRRAGGFMPCYQARAAPAAAWRR